jgi:hypothetical protein
MFYLSFFLCLPKERNKERAPCRKRLPTRMLLFFGVGDPSFGRIRVRRDANAQVTVLKVSDIYDDYSSSSAWLVHNRFARCLILKVPIVEECYWRCIAF